MFNESSMFESFPGGVPPSPPPEDALRARENQEVKDVLESERQGFLGEIEEADRLLSTLELPEEPKQKVAAAIKELKDFVWSTDFISGFGTGTLMLIALLEQRGADITPEQFLIDVGWFGSAGGVAAETMKRLGRELRAKFAKNNHE